MGVIKTRLKGKGFLCSFLGINTHNFVKNDQTFENKSLLKLVSAIFIIFLFFHQTVALQKQWKMFFIPSKKLFSFLRYSIFSISVLSSFSTCGHCFRGWSKINLKVCDGINCPNKNSIAHFVWYFGKEKRYDNETLSIDEVSDKEHFYRKIMQKMCSKS